MNEDEMLDAKELTSRVVSMALKLVDNLRKKGDDESADQVREMTRLFAQTLRSHAISLETKIVIFKAKRKKHDQT